MIRHDKTWRCIRLMVMVYFTVILNVEVFARDSESQILANVIIDTKGQNKQHDDAYEFVIKNLGDLPLAPTEPLIYSINDKGQESYVSKAEFSSAPNGKPVLMPDKSTSAFWKWKTPSSGRRGDTTAQGPRPGEYVVKVTDLMSQIIYEFPDQQFSYAQQFFRINNDGTFTIHRDRSYHNSLRGFQPLDLDTNHYRYHYAWLRLSPRQPNPVHGHGNAFEFNIENRSSLPVVPQLMIYSTNDKNYQNPIDTVEFPSHLTLSWGGAEDAQFVLPPGENITVYSSKPLPPGTYVARLTDSLFGLATTIETFTVNPVSSSPPAPQPAPQPAPPPWPELFITAVPPSCTYSVAGADCSGEGTGSSSPIAPVFDSTIRR